MARTCTQSTIEKLDALGWFPNFPASPAWAVSAFWDAQHSRPMSYERERRMCLELGIAPPPPMIYAPACEDCGSVHTGRCNGIDNPVVVVKRQRPAKPAWVVEATANLAALLEARQ